MRNFIIISVFFSFTFIFSQERQKIDGVAAVIGDFVVLESDIEKQFTQLRVSGVSMENISKCQVFGKLLEDKFFLDSIAYRFKNFSLKNENWITEKELREQFPFINNYSYKSLKNYNFSNSKIH